MKNHAFRSARFAALVVLLNLFFLGASAQITPRYISMTSNTNAYNEYLPQGYNPNGGETYPLLLHIHGTGELGPGNSSTLYKTVANSPGRLMRDGQFPSSFTVNGRTSKFIALFPQFVAWPSSAQIAAVIEYAKSHYRVDPSRIYLTGLSMGGGVTWDYASNPSYVNSVAAIVPVCGATSANLQKARVMANNNLPVWALHNDNDWQVSVNTTINFVNFMNQAPAPNPLARKTVFNRTDHDAWTQAFDPNYREEGKNVYEWMLQYTTSRSGSASSNILPVVNAGNDQSINLPQNYVWMSSNAYDPDGSIVKYQWSKVSGPSTINISDPNATSPIINNMGEGSYVLRLTVTDNRGATSSDDLTINVGAAAGSNLSVDLGEDVSIDLPVNYIWPQARTSGTIRSYQWSKISGPSTFNISNTSEARPIINNLGAGSYVVRLTVTDYHGNTRADDMTLNVRGGNTGLNVDLGADVNIDLPVNYIWPQATTSGNIRSYQWSKVSGPGTFNMSSYTEARPIINNLGAGSYVVRLTVTDDNGNSKSDDMTLNVRSGNTGLSVNLGDDMNIDLPTNYFWPQVSTTGSPVAYEWTKVSGPGTFNMSSTSEARPIINNLGEGQYNVRVTVRDNAGNTATDDMTFWVRRNANGRSTQPRTLKVKVYGGADAYSATDWNNWNVGTAVGYNINSNPFKYADGTTSGIRATLSQTSGIGDNTAAYSSGMAPKEVLRHTSWSTENRSLTLTGLNPTVKYDFEFYASRALNANNSTRMKSGNLQKTVNSFHNLTDKIQFFGLTPDASGNLVISIEKESQYDYLNGFMITEGSTSATFAARTQEIGSVNEEKEITSFPEASKDRVAIRISNKLSGQFHVTIMNLTGDTMREFDMNKSKEGKTQQYLSLGDLTAGKYVVIINQGDYMEATLVTKIQ